MKGRLSSACRYILGALLYTTNYTTYQAMAQCRYIERQRGANSPLWACWDDISPVHQSSDTDYYGEI